MPRWRAYLGWAALGLLLGLGDVQQAKAEFGDAYSAQQPMSTDNPGFTNVTQPAPRLRLITEQSVRVDLDDAATSLTVPGLLARFGVADWLELRAFAPSLVATFPDAGDASVATDQVGLGVLGAWSLAENLAVSATPVVSFPLEGEHRGVRGVSGLLQGNLSWSVSAALAIDLGAGIGWTRQPAGDGTATRARGLFGALANLALSGTTSLYIESYASCLESVGCEPSLGGGGAWYLTPVLQVHLAASTGLGDDAPPPSLTLGSVIGW